MQSRLVHFQTVGNPGCLDEESWETDRVTDYGSRGDGCFVGRLAALDMFLERTGNVQGS